MRSTKILLILTDIFNKKTFQQGKLRYLVSLLLLIGFLY